MSNGEDTITNSRIDGFFHLSDCLAAGVLSIAMGPVTSYPFALASGMGLNAVVAHDLILTRGLAFP